jgi:hypothetical protein
MNGVEATPLLGGMKMHNCADELWVAGRDERVWIHSGRYNVSRNGAYFGRDSIVDYAWYVFERGYSGAPTVGWLL